LADALHIVAADVRPLVAVAFAAQLLELLTQRGKLVRLPATGSFLVCGLR
jgi:hypothetical protein